jgi:TetR/AcrR family transcriptional regulator, transcriptional repressor for nem operon
MSTRDHLLKLAEEQIGGRGLNAVSFGNLAEALGIRKASVHHHFTNKAALIEALLERYQSAYETMLCGIEAAHPRGHDRLLHFIAMRRARLEAPSGRSLVTALAGDRTALSLTAHFTLARIDRDEHLWLSGAFRAAEEEGLSLEGHAAREASQLQVLVTGAESLAYLHAHLPLFDNALAIFKARLA